MSEFTRLLAGIKVPEIMGILNVTEDSFSDGGKFLDPDTALRHTEQLISEGADIIDIGGESTRPGSHPLPVEMELDRVIPVMEKIRQEFGNVRLSVDTRKAVVAREAIALGVEFINDISALAFDPAMVEVLRGSPEVRVILMHMQGEPETMQNAPHYNDLLREVNAFFTERLAYAENGGIARDRILLDPGLGFGKNTAHNLGLLANLSRLQHFGLPLVIGASRKSFIAALNPSSPYERLGGSLAAALASALQQADIVRVHDVKAHRQFFAVLAAIAGETQ